MPANKKCKVLFHKLVNLRTLLAVVFVILLYLGYHGLKERHEKQEHLQRATRILEPGSEKPLFVKVFYECLCPDSKSFFVKQLLPAIRLLSKYVDVGLVPYGKAKTESVGLNNYKFSCQHGEIECLGNKIHACVIDKVKDPMTRLEIVTCMIKDNISPEDIGRTCSTSHNADWDEISACVQSKEGMLLLKKHGEETHALVPKVKFIPTILVNDSRDNQAELLKAFRSEMCRLLTEMLINAPECS